MVWLVRGLIFGSLVTSAIAVPMALLSVQKSPRLLGAKKFFDIAKDNFQ